ncbi:hypothetical protein ACFX2C_035769 [Malus domestica]
MNRNTVNKHTSSSFSVAHRFFHLSSFNHRYPPTPQLSFLFVHQPNFGSSSSSSSSLKFSNFPKTLPSKSPTTLFSLAKSDSPKSFQPNSPIFQSLLQELADSFDLSDDYLAQLPNDFRLDVINKKSLSSAQEDLCRLMDLVLLREQHARTLLICRGLNVTIDEVCEALLEGVCFTRRSLRILQFLLIAFYPIWKDFKLNRELEYRPFWLYIGSCCGVDTNMPCTYFTI